MHCTGVTILEVELAHVCMCICVHWRQQSILYQVNFLTTMNPGDRGKMVDAAL